MLCKNLLFWLLTTDYLYQGSLIFLRTLIFAKTKNFAYNSIITMAGKKKLIEITDQEIEKIYDAGKETTVSFIRTIVNKVNELAEIVEKQQKEIDYLKSIISKDSHNSNKPPSSDNPYKKKTKSLRKKGGKVGGQKGHKGTNLKWKMNPDKIEKINAIGDCECGKNIIAGECIEY